MHHYWSFFIFFTYCNKENILYSKGGNIMLQETWNEITEKYYEKAIYLVKERKHQIPKWNAEFLNFLVNSEVKSHSSLKGKTDKSWKETWVFKSEETEYTFELYIVLTDFRVRPTDPPKEVIKTIDFRTPFGEVIDFGVDGDTSYEHPFGLLVAELVNEFSERATALEKLATKVEYDFTKAS